MSGPDAASGDVFARLDEQFQSDVLAVAGTYSLSTAVAEPTGLAACDWQAVFDSQVRTRHLDRASRWLQSVGAGFYTIGSAGHEANALVAEALRNSDPALLHYRSGAFYLQRAQREPSANGLRDVLLSMVASVEDPGSAGRHKVFANHRLSIIPQTSTIASHLPRAVGTAFAVERAKALALATRWPDDAVVVCSFGDASANHSTAVGALNAASWCAHRGLPLPLLWVCEDNGIGISVRTPPGWIKAAFSSRPGVKYYEADGSDPANAWGVIATAADYVRRRRRPAFLHLKVCRFGGHAGSDVESAYRSAQEIAGDLTDDPLVATARFLVQSGQAQAEDLIERYEQLRAEVMSAAEEVATAPKRLTVRAEVVRPLQRLATDQVATVAGTSAPDERRREIFGRRLPEEEGGLTLALAINRALQDAAAKNPGLTVFGEDVGRKGGNYGVTRGLQRALGPSRVFDTLLDEQTVLGLGLGMGLSGFLPVPEVGYLAYLHNAEDQLRGEGASLAFFSNGDFHNPMVLRVAGYAYQKGFGGHFHNDNAVGVLRDVPGLVVATPTDPQRAPALLRSCLAAAETDGRVCVYLEPIALYHERDLHVAGDGEWTSDYAPPDQWPQEHIPVGRGYCYGDGSDLTLITFGNGVRMSRRVAKRLEEDLNVSARVLDMQWLSPLPTSDIMEHAEATGRVLVVDETRRSGGVSEGVIACLVDNGFRGSISRVAAADSYVPLGDAARLVLVTEDEIFDAGARLMKDG